ncbi:Ldh family oxidoreductase [Candidatus Margulisiibacteriota bacterium]
MKKIKAQKINCFFEEIFDRINCPKKISRLVIEGLVETSLRGIDSHGIRLLPHYVKAAKIGRINLNPKIKIKNTSISTAILDADHTYGIAAATLAMENSIRLAKKAGIGCTLVTNSTHFGAAAIYTLLAAKQNMIGISSTNVDALVFPFGGKELALGTNPLSFAAPVEGEDPFCLDMATSIISWNKLMQSQKNNKPLKGGWAADKNGKIGLLPIGEYKGYGLALMVEILCSILTNMPYGKHVSKMYPLDKKKRRLGHFLLALDVSRFLDLTLFKKRLSLLLSELRAITPAAGFKRVKVANDPENETFKIRIKEGIPVDEDDLISFTRIAKKLKIKTEKYL